MARPPRIDLAGYAYHVLNRSVGRRRMFAGVGDYAAFERALAEAVARAGGDVALLAYCLMPNHWHLVLTTSRDGALSPFMKWLTLTHTQRYQVAHRSVGEGPVYQGRYKSMLVEQDSHLLTACRYVERNAARAALVERAEDWRWSSLWRWRHRKDADIPADEDPALTLSDWPISGSAKGGGGRPRNWLRTVNSPVNEAEAEAIRRSIRRSRPYGGPTWVDECVASLGLESTTRRPGRPANRDTADETD